MHLVARTPVNVDRKAVYNDSREPHECRVLLAMSLHAMIYIAFSSTFGLGHNKNSIIAWEAKIMLETGQVLTLYVLWFVFAFALAAFVLKKNS